MQAHSINKMYLSLIILQSDIRFCGLRHIDSILFKSYCLVGCSSSVHKYYGDHRATVWMMKSNSLRWLQQNQESAHTTTAQHPTVVATTTQSLRSRRKWYQWPCSYLWAVARFSRRTKAEWNPWSLHDNCMPSHEHCTVTLWCYLQQGWGLRCCSFRKS